MSDADADSAARRIPPSRYLTERDAPFRVPAPGREVAVRDGRGTADRIVARPWSDRRIGATGLSGPGAASDVGGGAGRAAMKAVAPLRAARDARADHERAGGRVPHRLAPLDDALMAAMDQDRRDRWTQAAAFAGRELRAPAPVDGNMKGALAPRAIAGHAANLRLPDARPDPAWRTGKPPGDAGFPARGIGPCAIRAGIRPDLAGGDAAAIERVPQGQPPPLIRHRAGRGLDRPLRPLPGTTA
ncbi:MAG: hypothetical protein K2X11_06600 [Acetobacteraceae bacterium]|nr:hypothetical protein [Acetobacteraceae bacterium]